MDEDQRVAELEAFRQSPGHELVTEHVRARLAGFLQAFLTGKFEKAEELLRLQADAAATYDLMRAISLDDIDAFKFARDELKRMEMGMKEAEESFLKQREAELRKRRAYPA